MLNLDHVDIEAPCPRCGYRLEIQMVDVRTQAWRWCPCCRAQIRLTEPDGSVSGSTDQIRRALRELNAEIGKLFS
jgi:hypothetical protein